MSNTMKKILVTGANGFIGQYVVENLVNSGYSVLAFDRHDKIAVSENVEIFRGDVRDFVAVNEAVALCDGVIHLAAVLGTSETVNEPRPAVETNIYGSLNVFQSCRNYHVPCVYICVGNYWMHNSYAITKTTAEKIAMMFNKEHNTKISIVRALNAYGPRQKHSPVRKIIPNFIIPALKDEEIIIYGDGNQIMDMIYVSDVADVLVKALTQDHGQYIHNPYREDLDNPIKFDAGSGLSTTVNEIANEVIRLVGSGRIKHVPMREGEPERSIVLGKPETLKPLYNGEIPKLISLEDGLMKTIQYYKENIKKYN